MQVVSEWFVQVAGNAIVLESGRKAYEVEEIEDVFLGEVVSVISSLVVAVTEVVLVMEQVTCDGSRWNGVSREVLHRSPRTSREAIYFPRYH